MTDIVHRLRINEAEGWQEQLMVEAADEIERQQADINKLMSERDGWLQEIERMRAALQEISDLCKTSPADPFLADNMDRMAHRALEPKP